MAATLTILTVQDRYFS